MIALRSLIGLTLLSVVTSSTFGADQQQINAAIAKGATFLQSQHNQQQGGYTGGNHGVGSAGLAGITMLVGGTKSDNPAIQNITLFIRQRAPSETATYNIALAILFLDRLGDPRDVPAIQLLGTRLYGGMTRDGGYGYQCVDLVAMNNLGQLGNQQMTGQGGVGPKTEKPKPDNGFPTVQPNKDKPSVANPGKLHPSVAPYNAAVRQMVRANGRAIPGGDNSNTQFGLIGLWVASRHGVPCDDAFLLLEAHFLTTQSRADFGWSYSGNDQSTTSMTCAGLLGLAIGSAREKPSVKDLKPEPGKPDTTNDPFFNPKKGKEEGVPKFGGVNPLVPGMTPALRKAAIDGALRSIGGVIRASRVNAANPGVGNDALRQFVGLGDQYYLLWSVERVAMAYELPTIGDQDWYAWGCEYLLPSQTENGSWGGGSHGEDVNTAFAVLFLSKSNFVADLTAKIKGQVKDPGKTEMRAGKNFTPPLLAPQTKNDGGNTPAPPEAPPTNTPDAIATDLIKGTGWDVKLSEARDTKGAEYTSGLVKAIPKLVGDRQTQAREALAERLTRMTAKTLRTMLRETDVELRRAATLACAMKDDKTHIPDLIDRITDSSDLVVRAARAGLKSLTQQDFGPPPNSDEAAKAKAVAEWNKWYLIQAKP